MLYPIPQQEILALINAQNPGSTLTLADISYEIVSQEADGTATVKVTPKEGVKYYGEQTITYRKRELASSVRGLPVRLLVNANTTVKTLIELFAAKYGYSFDQMTDFTQEELNKEVSFAESGIQVVEIPASASSLVWIGSLSITVSNDALDLSTIIVNADLTQLKYLSGASTVASIKLATIAGDFKSLKTEIAALDVGAAMPSTLAQAVHDALKAQEITTGDEPTLVTALTGQTLASKDTEGNSYVAVFNAVNDNADWAGGAILHYDALAPVSATPPPAGSDDFPADNVETDVDVLFTVNRDDPNMVLNARLTEDSPSYASIANPRMTYVPPARSLSAMAVESVAGQASYSATVNVAAGNQKQGDVITVIVSDANGNDIGSYQIVLKAPTLKVTPPPAGSITFPADNVAVDVTVPFSVNRTDTNIQLTARLAEDAPSYASIPTAQLVYTGTQGGEAIYEVVVSMAGSYQFEGQHIGVIVSNANKDLATFDIVADAATVVEEPKNNVYEVVWGTLGTSGSSSNITVNFGSARGTIDWGDGKPVAYTGGEIQKFYSSVKPTGNFIATLDESTIIAEPHKLTGPGIQEIVRWVNHTVTQLQGGGTAVGQGMVNLVKLPDTMPKSWLKMDFLFSNTISFDQDLSGWDVSNVTSMYGMVYNSTSFTGKGLENWKTNSLTTMNSFAYQASKFNANMPDWDVSKVTNMDRAFYNASLFNGALTNWNTESLTSAATMFSGANVFNQPMNHFKVGKLTTLDSFFRACRKFNQPLDQWDTSKVTSFSYMFYDCSVFNSSINTWNTAKVTNMASMFYQCGAFNQNISGWNTALVTNMSSMWRAARAFNQNLSGWNVAKVTNRTDYDWGLTTTQWPAAYRPPFA